MKTTIIKSLNLWFPVVLWAVIIFKFSSGTIPNASQIYWQDFAVKKIGHFLLFGVLSVLLYRAFIGQGLNRKKSAIWAILLALFYGATDEFHQMFTQGRESRVRDIIIDGIGASVIIYIVYKYLPTFPKKFREFLLQFGIS